MGTVVNPEVSLGQTRSFTLKSKEVGDEFLINLAFPKNYDPENRIYPVVYLTDANIFFALVTQTIRLLNFNQEIPPVILVAVGYPRDEDHLTLRERDLTPTPWDKGALAGEASRFLSFLTEELMPLINDDYPVDPADTTLMGDSYGGLFGLYALFNHPDTFKRYIIGSPSIYWDNSVIMKMEEAYSKKSNSLPVRVFLSAGQLEAVTEPEHAGMLSNVAKLTEIFSSRKYEGLNLSTHFFPDETHLSVIPATFSRGLREVFSN